jgi:hypothetical protein
VEALAQAVEVEAQAVEVAEHQEAHLLEEELVAVAEEDQMLMELRLFYQYLLDKLLP